MKNKINFKLTAILVSLFIGFLLIVLGNKNKYCLSFGLIFLAIALLIYVVSKYQQTSGPMRMLYTGNLLIGREKSLQKIANALKRLNAKQTKIVLDVYTQTQLSDQYLQETQNDFCKI